MTVASVAPRLQYDGNDVTTEFPFPYLFFENSHLVVKLTDTNGADTTLVLNTDYTVTGAGDESGGTITYPVSGDPLATGEILTIYRVVPYTQLMDLGSQGFYFQPSFEKAVDLIVMSLQQIKEITDRCVKTTETDTEDPPTLADFQDMIDSGFATFALAFAALTQIATAANNDRLMIWDTDASSLHYATVDQVVNAFYAALAQITTAVYGDRLIIYDVDAAALKYATIDQLIAAGRVPYGAKGADVASATNLTLGSDGNYFHITGTTTIESIGTKGVGKVEILEFDGTPTLKHHATNLILPGGVDIATAAGDVAIFVEESTGKWRCLGYQKASVSPRFRGALVKMTSDQSISDGVDTFVNWTAETYDTDSIHDNSTNNTRLTVPAGVTKVRLSYRASWAFNATGARGAIIYKNAAPPTTYDGAAAHKVNAVITSPLYTEWTATSPVLEVTGGDYFELRVFQDSGGNLDFKNSSWFAMEIIE